MLDDTLSPTPLPDTDPVRQDVVARLAPYPDHRGRQPWHTVRFVGTFAGKRWHIIAADKDATGCGIPYRSLPYPSTSRNRARLPWVCKTCLWRTDARAIGYESVVTPTIPA